MIQQYPLPTEEQVPAEDSKLSANRVFQVAAILFGGHILSTNLLRGPANATQKPPGDRWLDAHHCHAG
jgi:hypothetical protein